MTNLSRERLRQLIVHGDIKGAQMVGNAYGIPEDEVERLKRRPKSRGHWPKGKPRKPTP